MQKIKEKLNANAVGATSSRTHFEEMAQNKGITLIALIITIIVMLILVGVTINVALNGGLFTKAETATRATEEKAILEEMLAMMEIDDNGKFKYETIISNMRTKHPEYTIVYSYPNAAITGKLGTYNYIVSETQIKIGGNTPVAFTWESVGLENVDTDAEYIFNNSVVLKFFDDGILTVKSGEIEMLRIDAKISDNIENGKIKYSGVVNGQDAIVKLENNESNIDMTIIWLEEDGTEGDTQIINCEKTILAIGDIYDKTYKGQVRTSFMGGVNLYVTFKENPKIALITTKSPTEVEWSDLAFYPYEYTIDSENLIITVENFDNIVFSIRGDRIYGNYGTELKFLDYSYFDYYTPEKCDVIDTNSLYYNFKNGAYTSSYGYVGISIEKDYVWVSCNGKASAVHFSTDDKINEVLGSHGIRITEEGKLRYSKDGGEEVELTLIEQF